MAEPEQDDPSETVYKRRVGISLATLAVLAAFIAFVQTGASSNESATARQATRLASEAQTADVLAKGVQTGLDEIDAELRFLPEREVFGAGDGLASQFGVEIDPDQAERRLAAAEESISRSLGDSGDIPARLATEAERLSLEQQLVVDQRVSWNAKASQYDTVLTVLAVAIFLVGFTLVVGRNLRPPLAIPGLLLALVCAGWAAQIYLKPTPEVTQDSIDSTAEGRYLNSTGDADAAVASFDEALKSTPEYTEALISRAYSKLLLANPDLQRTLAWTDTSPEVLGSAAADVQLAIDSGAEEDPVAWAVAATVAVGQGDWDAAAEFLEEGIRLNELAAELYLWRAAVATAQGDAQGARGWLDQARERFGDLDEDRVRTLAAQYLTLLEYVIVLQPDRQDLASELEAAGIATLAQARNDSPLVAGSSLDASISSATASFENGFTTVSIDVEGVDEGDQILIAGFEDPGGDNGWIQSPELFYTGPVGQGGGDGVTIRTPRNCEPTAHRFDLYVEGELRDSVVVPGGEATC